MWIQSLAGKDPPEKVMTTHSSILVWRILWTEEPGRLQSFGLQRVGYHWSDLWVIFFIKSWGIYISVHFIIVLGNFLERQRIDTFELWCWRRLLRVCWTAGRSNESILNRRLVLGVHWRDWCWSWNSNTLATWCEELTHLKRLWCWERLRAGGEGDGRRWDGWMTSTTQWTWVWVDSGSRWWTGRPGLLWFMGLQRVRHDWATELNWTEVTSICYTDAYAIYTHAWVHDMYLWPNP